MAASSRRDVELVIRAKNDANKAVGSLTDALDLLVNSQDDVVKSSSKTESVLDRLGSAFKNLNKAFGGATVASKLSVELDRATTAMSRLEAGSRQAASENARLTSTAGAAAAAARELARETQNAGVALATQQIAAEKAQAAQKALTGEYDRAINARDRLANKDTQLRDALNQQITDVRNAREAFKALEASIAGQQGPQGKLRDDIIVANQALNDQQAKLEKAKTALSDNSSALDKAEHAVIGFGFQLERANAEVAKQEAALLGVKQGYAVLAEALSVAEKNEKTLKDAAGAAAEALARQEGQLAQARADLAALGVAADEANVSLDKLANESTKALQLSFDKQRRSTLEAKREWVNAQEAVNTLAIEIASTEEPTIQMATAFDKVRDAAREAKTEYQLQREGLHGLSAILAETGGDLDALASRQDRFAAVQGETAAAIDKVRKSAGGTASELLAVAAAERKAGDDAAKAATQIKGEADAMSQGGKSTETFSEALKRLYGNSRQAMSFLQRLRGEVLALVSSYLGLFAAINAIDKVIDATVQLGAAQSRLNAIFDGDQAKVADELDFIRRASNRLGISFGTLADEYTKFASSTIGTNIAGERTRQIFIAVAEAARVNNLSIEDVQGAIVALGQIASKGTLSMEELKQQLGDRIPAALKLMADGLGITTGQLLKLISTGKISSDSLIGFADQLEKRYGKAVPAAMETLGAKFGQLQNAVFQAALAFTDSGFGDALEKIISDLTTNLQSPEGEAFLRRLGVLIGGVVDGLDFLIRNFNLVVDAMVVFVGIKIIPFVSILITKFGDMRAALALSTEAAIASAAAARATGGAMASAAAGVTTFVSSLRTLLGTTGIGLLVAGIGIAIGEWVTSADDATVAMNSHRKIVDQVKDAYDKAADKAKDWADEVARGSTTQAIDNLKKLKSELDDVRSQADNSFLAATAGVPEGSIPIDEQFVGPIRDAIKAFQDGTDTADQFKAKIDAIGRDAPPEVQKLAVELLNVGDKAKEAETNVAAAQAVLHVLEGTATDADKALLGLGDAAKKSGNDLNDAAGLGLKAYADGLDKIKALIPELAGEMKRLAEQAKLDDIVASLGKPKDFETLIQQLMLVARARMAINKSSADSAVTSSLVDRIIGTESAGDASAKNPNSSATGLGQFIKDTWLDLFKRYFPDQAASMSEKDILELRKNADVSRKLVEAYAKENAEVLQKAGVAVNDAAIYLAHFLGPGGAVSVLKADRSTPIDQVMSADQISANGFDSPKSKIKTAGDLIDMATKSVSISKEEAGVQEDINKIYADRAAKQEEFTRGIDEMVNKTKLESAAQQQTGLAQAVTNALQEKELEARKLGLTLTDAERKAIGQAVTQQYLMEHALERANALRAQAAEGEKKITDLSEVRAGLEEKLALQLQHGDFTGASETMAAITAIDSQLDGAIDKAIEFWKAMGGPEADAAILKLQNMKIGIHDAADTALIDWSKVQDLFVNGLTNAFDNFSQSVAEGVPIAEAAKNAFLEFASDFLREIAKMIEQQLILNLIRSVIGSFAGSVSGGGGNIAVPTGHVGGFPNRRTATRSVPAALFANAQRLHTGGFPGLMPGEVPAILKKNERVLTDEQQNNWGMPGASAGPAQLNAKIINLVDSEDVVSKGLDTPAGTSAFINVVTSKKSEINAILDGK